MIRRLVALGSSLLLLGTTAASPSYADEISRGPVHTFTIAAVPHEAFGVARSPSGRLWVSLPDGSSGTIRQYTVSGAEQPEHASSLNGPGQGEFDANGNYIVPLSGANALAAVAPSGALVTPPDVLGLSSPRYLTIDHGQIFVSSPGNDSVVVTGSGGSYSISGPNSGLASPYGIAVGRNGLLYVANHSGGIKVFAKGAGGNVAPVRTLATPPSFGEVYALDLDDGDNLYVEELTGKVAVYPAGASTWSRIMTPSDTSAPHLGMIVNADRTITMADLAGVVSTYAPLVPYRLPGKIRALKVAGKAIAKRRTVTWLRPLTSDKPITSYVVRVRKGSKVLVTRTVTTGRIVLQRSKLKAGRLTVSVQARSAVGLGPALTIAFTVKKPR